MAAARNGEGPEPPRAADPGVDEPPRAADPGVDETLCGPDPGVDETPCGPDPGVDETLCGPDPGVDETPCGAEVDETLCAADEPGLDEARDLGVEETLAEPAGEARDGAAGAAATGSGRASSRRLGASPPIARASGLRRGEALGRYLVLERLGVGGMGEVYSAYDPDLDRRVAVKVIRPAPNGGSAASAQARLLDEARALARLAHPNVVAVFDVGAVGGDVFLAMELVEGTTFSEWCRERERSWREVVEVVVAAGRGLEAAHAAGLVHRDVKPDNIVLGRDGRVRVIDFGVALAKAAGPSARMTESSLVGTPGFMAPEQFSGDPVGPQTDQFSLGVTLYVALWGRRPFEGDTLAAISTNLTEGRLVPPPEGGVPRWLREAVVRALAREPGARHPTMGAMLEALQPAPPRRARWPWLAALGAVAALAIGLAVALGIAPSPPPCTGFEAELAGVWDPERRAAVAEALSGSSSRAEVTAVTSTLDAYAAAWLERKVEACRATVVTREQSAAVLERRLACLDTRRRELDAVVVLLASGSGLSGRAGFESASGLRALAQCDNLAGLGRGGPPAGAAPDEVLAIEDGLARLRALRLAAEYQTARREAEALVERADRLGWAAASARALVEQGRIAWLDGDPAGGRETLFEAIRRGAEADDDASQAEAWVVLVGVEAAGLRQPTEALRWARHAEVALARAGGDQELRGLLLHYTGSALRGLERHEEAMARLLEARALFVHALGQRHFRVAAESAAISNAYRNLGQNDRAIVEGEAALELAAELLGDRAPALGPMLNNLALAYDAADRTDDARRALERSIALREDELGPNHPSLSASLMNLSGIERRAGRLVSAETLWQRAHDIRLAALGPRHPDVTRALTVRSFALAATGRDDEAHALAREVVSRLRSQADAADLPSALGLLCELERRHGALEAAARSCAEALEALGDSPDPSRAVEVLSFAARTATACGERDRAVELLDRARDALRRVTRHERLAAARVGWAAAHLARAAGREDDAAREAGLARAAFGAADQSQSYYLDDLERLVPGAATGSTAPSGGSRGTEGSTGPG